jgi:uncharacterized PurR-regulated membrane protein YhhQ (DUF165 family)
MMITLTDCLLLALLLLGLTTVGALRSRSLLVIACTMMMICVSLLGTPIVMAFGYVTNVGNIFFAAVMYGLTLKYYRFGIDHARAMVINILFALLIVYGAIFMLERGQSLNPMFGVNIRIAGASFVSFWLVQSFFIVLLDRYAPRHLIWRAPLISAAMQALYNAVSVPCSFSSHFPLDLVLEFAVVGWIINACVAICSMPFLLAFGWITRNDTPPPSARDTRPAASLEIN